MVTIPLSLLIERGMQIEAAEAIAIVQTLASSSGEPSLENVEVDSEGGARFRNTLGEPTVGALATLLNRLLPHAGVAAPLRYTIARGLGAVEAPAFQSVEEFSQALDRFQSGDRGELIRGLLARARPQRRDAPTPVPTPVPAPVPAPAPMPAVSKPRITVAPAPRARPAVAAPLPPPRLPQRSFLPVLYIAGALALSALGGYAIVDFTLSQQRLPEIRGAATAPPAAQTTASPAPVPEPARRGEVRKAAVRSNAPVRMLPAPERGYSPAFASNGTALFFQTGGANDPTSAIAVGEPAPGASDDLRIMKIVDDGSRNYHAQPSPDGRFVAFDSDRDGVRGVYIAARDGSNVRRISEEGYAALPSWSPDGTHIAFVRAEPGEPAVWNLWMQRLADGTAQRLTRYHYGQTWSASWFPDGRRIAYSHETELTILDLTTGRMRHIPTPVHGRLVRTPAVSPDGSRIVFQVFRAGVWMLNVADGSMECVLADPTAEEFAWAPDGRRFAFHSHQDGRWSVYVLSAPAA